MDDEPAVVVEPNEQERGSGARATSQRYRPGREVQAKGCGHGQEYGEKASEVNVIGIQRPADQGGDGIQVGRQRSFLIEEVSIGHVSVGDEAAQELIEGYVSDRPP